MLDELCSGTNPSEDEQIFELVVTMLAHLRPQVFITTHFLAFAARCASTRGISGLRQPPMSSGDARRQKTRATARAGCR